MAEEAWGMVGDVVDGLYGLYGVDGQYGHYGLDGRGEGGCNSLL